MATMVHSSIDDQGLVGERRQQFVVAATTLFSSKSYDAVTMKDISKEAGFSSGLIYSYVQTKDDMLFLVLQNLFDSYLREIPESLETVTDPVARFCCAVGAYCKVIDRHSDATLLAYRATKSLSLDRRTEIKKMEFETNRFVADCVRTCIDAGFFRAQNVELLTYQVVMMAHGWALKRWALGQAMTLEKYVQSIIGMFLRGVMTGAGWQQWEKVEMPSLRSALGRKKD